MQQSITEVIEGRFVYSCTFERQRGYEQFVPECLLACQISGETQLQFQVGTLTLQAGQLLLARRDQLVKSLKLPANDQPYKIISVVFPVNLLQQFAAENAISFCGKYQGHQNILLKPDTFFEHYFLSLLPYVEQADQVDMQLGTYKSTEALHLLLRMHPELSGFLFDFTSPYKMDLEKFMTDNYRYNVPVEVFARMTGRSLAAFKRDFKTVFQVAPRKWLLEKRLSAACAIMEQTGKKPNDIYLEVGFENLSHFYKAFKHKFGVTPANFKNYYER